MVSLSLLRLRSCTDQIRPLPTAGVAVICALSMAWISDGVLRGRRWPMQVVSSTWALSSAIVLIAIPVFAHTKLHFCELSAVI
jgi:sugar phosphate permease